MANLYSFGGGASFSLGKSEEATGLNGKLKEDAFSSALASGDDCARFLFLLHLNSGNEEEASSPPPPHMIKGRDERPLLFYFLPLFLQEKGGESNDVWSIFFHSALGEDRDEARRIFLSFLLSSNLDLLDVGSGLEISLP